MSDFIRVLTHSRRLKTAVKELSIEQLEEIKTKLEAIIDERIAEVEAEKQGNAERLEKIRKYKEMLAADGIELEDLATGSEHQSKRAPRQPKYEVWNEAGERITWTGQGRMPNIFKKKIEERESLDTFLIDQ